MIILFVAAVFVVVKIVCKILKLDKLDDYRGK